MRATKRAAVVAVACGVLLLAGACSGASSPDSASTPSASTSPLTAADVSLVLPAVGAIKASSTTDQTVNMPTSGLDDTTIALGGASLASTEPKAGYIWACRVPQDGPAVRVPPWVNAGAATWDATRKPAVAGDVTYPNRAFDAKVDGDSLVLTGNGLPQRSGTFPVAADDPVSKFNVSPDGITAHPVSVRLPLNPTVAAAPSCNVGFSGIAADGVPVLAGFDGGAQDSLAILTQDTCHGETNKRTGYHYHGLSPCLLTSTARKQTTQVGWAFDGFGMYVEYDADGAMLTNKDLDECHGRTSVVPWHGRQQSIYHYVMTAEFPYSVGCFRGTRVTPDQASGIGYPPPPPTLGR